ncbi:hypothetical protein LIER_12867 [Lithospermum erythrorhizon]|uniref:RNase H type-1 domain-containing protein n=1 Tax=Lithospermum erythrorhizon TaxID=34254 RepID=A0AAV3PTC8_LITER
MVDGFGCMVGCLDEGVLRGLGEGVMGLDDGDFCRASEKEGQELMNILQVYETASGRQINVGKSSVCYEPQKDFGQGVRWRVSDGKEIDIWKDPWIPRTMDFTARGEGVEGLNMVSQLLNNGQWNSDLVCNLFDKEDTERILSILLSKFHVRGKMVWHHTKCGNYLTSLGYISARASKKAEGLRNKPMGESNAWTGRGTFGKKFGAFGSLHGFGISFGEQIWVNRINLVADYLRLNTIESGQGTEVGRATGARTVYRWRQPQQGFIKINIDAGWWKKNSVEGSLVAEAYALREGFSFDIRHDLKRVEFESDALQLIKVVNAQFKTPLEINVLVEDIHHLTIFLKVKFQFTDRQSNHAAHCVAH